jgi:CheY-like chemotaxis protein
MAAMGGALDQREQQHDQWSARLVWPVATPHTLLVIDDNQDFVDLFRRYLAGYNWQVIGAVDGVEARQALAEIAPTVIILDVMMPREDGWELLVALRAESLAGSTPIIISSVLNEPRLARTLGAADYLAKPVSQAALLHALAPWSQAGASRLPEH